MPNTSGVSAAKISLSLPCDRRWQRQSNARFRHVSRMRFTCTHDHWFYRARYSEAPCGLAVQEHHSQPATSTGQPPQTCTVVQQPDESLQLRYSCAIARPRSRRVHLGFTAARRLHRIKSISRTLTTALRIHTGDHLELFTPVGFRIGCSEESPGRPVGRRGAARYPSVNHHTRLVTVAVLLRLVAPTPIA